MNSIRLQDARLVEGKAAFDAAPIVVEELDRLGSPLPVGVARLGPRGIVRQAIDRLREHGKTTFTPREYRIAVVRVLQELVKNDPKIKLSDEEAWQIQAHASAELLLAREGKLEGYSSEDYVGAITLAGYGIEKAGGRS